MSADVPDAPQVDPSPSDEQSSNPKTLNDVRWDFVTCFFNMHFFVMSCLDVSMYNKGFVFCNFRSKDRYGNTWQTQRALRLRMPTRCGWNLMPGLLSRLDAKDPKFD